MKKIILTIIAFSSLTAFADSSLKILRWIPAGTHSGTTTKGDPCWVFVNVYNSGDGQATLTVSRVDPGTRPSPGDTVTFHGNAEISNAEKQNSLNMVKDQIPDDSYTRRSRASLNIIRLSSGQLKTSVETKSRFLGMWTEKAQLECIL